MDKQVFMHRIFKDAPHVLTSEYGERINPVTGLKKLHDGEDWGVYRKTGIRLYSPVFGIVIKSAYHYSMGNHVFIKTSYGIVRMLHLASRNVVVGQEVIPGTCIGVCGSTGYSTGIHLHLGTHSLLDKTMAPNTFIKNYVEDQAYTGLLPVGIVKRGFGTKEDVMRWQRFLCWFGANVTIDGEPGADTEAKTIIFQRYVGLTPDGSVGKLTNGEARDVRRA